MSMLHLPTANFIQLPKVLWKDMSSTPPQKYGPIFRVSRSIQFQFGILDFYIESRHVLRASMISMCLKIPKARVVVNDNNKDVCLRLKVETKQPEKLSPKIGDWGRLPFRNIYQSRQVQYKLRGDHAPNVINEEDRAWDLLNKQTDPAKKHRRLTLWDGPLPVGCWGISLPLIGVFGGYNTSYPFLRPFIRAPELQESRHVTKLRKHLFSVSESAGTFLSLKITSLKFHQWIPESYPK